MSHLPFAYLGPGSGFAFLGSFLTLLLSLAASAVSFLLWPFRVLWRMLGRGRGSRKAAVKKVIFLGLDGLNAELAERLMAEGKLPNMTRLKEQGSYRRLRTTCPARSPAAWSTFATGVNPANGFSETFWRILGRHGVGSTILRVPGTFPPEPFEGRLLSSAPDLQGIRYRYSLFSRGTGLVEVDGDLAGELAGPGDSILFWIRNPEHDPHLEIQTETYPLKPREYTPWIHLKYGAVHGIVRFLATQTGPDFSLYATPVQTDPENPATPISYPPRYSIYLAKLLGPFSTQDMAGDTIDEDASLAQAALIQREREAMFFNALDHQSRGVVACVFDMADERMYGDMDRIVGRALEYVDRDTAIFVLSLVPGVLFSNRKIDAQDPGIEDMAPTALQLFGIQPPEWMNGKSICGADWQSAADC